MKYLFFDHAATTRCCDAAAQLLHHFASEDYGNPSSSHAFGQKASQAIREARQYFGQLFHVNAPQIIFTGSGTEADNLAVYGIAMSAVIKKSPAPPRVLVSAIEHPAVRKTAQSLASIGVDVQLIPVDRNAQIRMDALEKLLTPETVLVSIQQVNNIVGSILPVEKIARRCKQLQPGIVFHTDAVQAFGKVDSPISGSAIDLVSISGHKVQGPKGVGALIVLNASLLKDGIRPLIWGGGQEGGFRSGTQSAGLIAGFHAAARETLGKMAETGRHVQQLHDRFKEKLSNYGLVHPDPAKSLLHWNSPKEALPQITSLSLVQLSPGRSASTIPGGVLAKMLEERGCLISTGSACSSQKSEPDPVLTAMGLSPEICQASLRVSLSSRNTIEDIDTLTQAMEESVKTMSQLLG